MMNPPLRDATSRKLVVHVFPALSAASQCDPNAPCDCGVSQEAVVPDGEKHPNELVAEAVSAIREKFGERIDVDVASYADNTAIYASLDKLNAALLTSGKNFLVAPANFYNFVGTIAPLIAIDGRIVFTRKVPALEQLESSIQRALVGA